MLQDGRLVDVADVVDQLDRRHRAGSVVVDPGSLISDQRLVWRLIEDGCIDSSFGSQGRLCMQVCYVARIYAELYYVGQLIGKWATNHCDVSSIGILGVGHICGHGDKGEPRGVGRPA